MARVLIAGCGYVGSELARLLSGHKVYAIRRRQVDLPGVVTISADLTTLTTKDLPNNIDYVFYLASADASTPSAYHNAYCLGLSNLLAKLSCQPKRIFFSSSTSVYGQVDEEWVNEDSMTQPLDFKGETLLAAENLLRASGFPYCVIRFAGIYGSGRTRLIQAVAQAQATLSAKPVYTNRIHLADCAAVLMHLMNKTTLAPLYLAVDSEPVAKNEVLTWLATQLNVQLRSVEEAVSTQELTLRANKRCSNQRLIQSGYTFIYPSYHSGYLEQIQAWQYRHAL